MVIFHSYVKLPEGMGCFMGIIWDNLWKICWKTSHHIPIISPFGKYFTPNNWEMCVHLMFIWNVRLDVITSPWFLIRDMLPINEKFGILTANLRFAEISRRFRRGWVGGWSICFGSGHAPTLQVCWFFPFRNLIGWKLPYRIETKP